MLLTEKEQGGASRALRSLSAARRFLGALTELEGCPKPSNVQCGSWQTRGGSRGLGRPLLTRPREVPGRGPTRSVPKSDQAEAGPERRSQGGPKKSPRREEGQFRGQESQDDGQGRDSKNTFRGQGGVPGGSQAGPKGVPGGSQGGPRAQVQFQGFLHTKKAFFCRLPPTPAQKEGGSLESGSPGPQTPRGVPPRPPPKHPQRGLRAYALGLWRSQALQASSTGRLYPPSPFCRDARSGTSVEASSAHVNGQRRSRQFRV